LVIGAYLFAQEAKFNLKFHSEIHLRVKPARWRIPDVAALFLPPKDGHYPDDQTPPLFTIEIASPDEPWTVLRGKVSDHLAIRVSHVIIADPYNKTVMVATQDTPLRELPAPLVGEIPVPERGVLQIDFDDLFGKL
jgi:hypothetical protein